MKRFNADNKKQTIVYWCLFALLLIWIAFLGFYKLGYKYVDPWDEARHGVNAYEMLRAHNPIRNTYLYQTDLYNLKPPLSMWCQMVSFALLGANSFSLRAYSVLCYVGLAAMAALFMKRRFGHAASIVLLGFLACNTTPFAAHMIRSGDADSLYVLLFTASMVCMLQLRDKPKYLYLCGLFFALAFLTKSYHAGIIAVIGIGYLVLTGLWKKYHWKQYLLFLASCVAPILVWAIPRLLMDGTLFFREMLLTDVLGRTDGTLQNNVQPFGWYAQYFMGAMSGKIQIYLWAFGIVLGGLIVMLLTFKREWIAEQKDDLIGFSLWILLPFLAFSAVGNKLLWYLYPVTIPLFMAAAIIAGKVISMRTTPAVSRTICGVLLGALLAFYGKGVFDTVNAQTQVKGNEFQNLVESVAGQGFAEKDNIGTPAYVIYEPDETGKAKTEWAQQDVFVAEAYGGFSCKQAEELQLLNGSAVLFQSNLVSQPELPEGTTVEEIGHSENYTAYLIER